MSHILYAYIAEPTTSQVRSFLHALESHDIALSHLGKSDPPCKFQGSVDEAASIVFSGTDLTDYTFARDSARGLDFDFHVHHDPRWTHSTVSASCPNKAMLAFVADSVATAFELFLTIQGISGRGKEQPWEIICITERCPNELRAKFVRA